MYEQHHLHSSINFDIQKIKPGTLTARRVKNNVKEMVKRLVVRDNVFSFLSSVKERRTYWK